MKVSPPKNLQIEIPDDEFENNNSQHQKALSEIP